MKKKNKAIALLAALTVFVPNAVSPLSLMPAAAESEETAAAVKLPDWVPQDYEHALYFHTDYGRTHIEGEYLCMLFTENNEQALDETCYTVEESGGVFNCIYEAVFRLEKEENGMAYSPEAQMKQFRVMVFKAMKPGDTTILHKIKNTETLAYEYDVRQDKYTFTVGEDYTVTETDVFAWLPDCYTEIGLQLKEKKDSQEQPVFRHGNYVYVCLQSNDGTACSWKLKEESGILEKVGSICCDRIYTEPIAGQQRRQVLVFRAKANGSARIIWEKTDGTEVYDTIDINYEALKNASVLLAPNETLIDVLDADTGKLIDFDDLQADSNGAKVSYHLSYMFYPENKQGDAYREPSLQDYTLNMEQNSEIVDHSLTELLGGHQKTDCRFISYDKRYRENVDYSIDPLYNGALHIRVYLQYNPSGDLNRDDRLTIADAVCMQKLLSGTEVFAVNWRNADFYHDDCLDARDLTKMLRKICQRNYEPHSIMTLKTVYSGCGIAGQFLGEDVTYTEFSVKPGDQFYEKNPYGLKKTGTTALQNDVKPALVIDSFDKNGVMLSYFDYRQDKYVTEHFSFNTPYEELILPQFTICDGQNPSYTVSFSELENQPVDDVIITRPISTE